MSQRPDVVVLNQTRRQGLAEQVATFLESEGWEVRSTGNWRGAVPSTTVYYPTGLDEAAAALAATLPGSDRTRPRQSNMAGDALTVILHESYPG